MVLPDPSPEPFPALTLEIPVFAGGPSRAGLLSNLLALGASL